MLLLMEEIFMIIQSDIEKYRELKKVMIGKGEDYTTGSLLDCNYFKEHHKLVAVDLSKHKELDADPRAIQQIEFKYMLGTSSTIYWVLEKSKEAILEFYKGTVKGIKNFNKDELPHELLLTTRQNIKLRNAINNNLATDIKLSKAQIKKLIQSGGFLGKLLSKLAGPLMKVATSLAKNVLPPLGLTAAMSAIDGSIQKKIHGSGVKLIIEQEDMNDIMKIIKALENSGISLKGVTKTIENETIMKIMKIIEALENSGILLKGVTKTIENETKEQRGRFLSMLLGTLGASLLRNLLTDGKGMMRAGEGIVRAGEGAKKPPKFAVTFSSFNKH